MNVRYGQYVEKNQRMKKEAGITQCHHDLAVLLPNHHQNICEVETSLAHIQDYQQISGMRHTGETTMVTHFIGV